MTHTKRVLHRLKASDVEKLLRKGSGFWPDGRVRPQRIGDGGNLYLLVRGGAASWVFLATVNGKEQQYSIGSAHALADLSGSSDPLKRAGKSLEEARSQAAQMRENVMRGRTVKVQPVKVAQEHAWADILAYYCEKKGIEAKTLTKYTDPWEAIIRADGGAVYTRDLALKYMQELSKTRKPYTVNSYIKMMASMFNVYILDKQAEIKNPFVKLSLDVKEKAIDRTKSMPLEILNAMRAKFSGDALLILDMVAVTGARIGEIVGLKSSDITDEYINIDDNKKRSIKNPVSVRKIPNPFKLPKRDSEYYFNQSVNAATTRHSDTIRELTTDMRIKGHSLRHSVTDAFREANVQFIFENFYLGHANKDVAATDYGTESSRLKALKTHVAPVVEAYAKSLGIETDRRG